MFATKWHDKSMIPLKQKVIEKSLKLASHHASFAKIVCLLFFRDALDPKSQTPLDGNIQLELQTTVLAGARLLFQTDLKKVKTTFQEVFKAIFDLVISRNSLLI